MRASMTYSHSNLPGGLMRTAPDLDEASVRSLLRATRRIFLGALIDAEASEDKIRSAFHALFDAHVIRRSTAMKIAAD